MSKIRVIIIDQSEEICESLIKILGQDSHIDIIGYANDRDKGLRLMANLQPDVALIDIYLLKESDWTSSQFKSIPILLLSRPLVDEIAKTLRAMSLGAVDFIKKTELDEEDSQIALISKIQNAYRMRKSNVRRFRERQIPETSYINSTSTRPKEKLPNQKTVVAIGTSTGGPKALQRVLTELPKGFKAPVFIVQHMPSRFTKSLANRLNSLTDIQVKEATNEEIVVAGTAYIAPGDYHMTVSQTGKQFMIHLNQEKTIKGHRPSVDVLFDSIARLDDVHKIAVILTGMGKDGAMGIKQIKERDQSAVIIAESEQSAVIYGMPAAALETNCVTDVAHIEEIGELITNHVER